MKIAKIPSVLLSAELCSPDKMRTDNGSQVRLKKNLTMSLRRGFKVFRGKTSRPPSKSENYKTIVHTINLALINSNSD